MNPEKFLENHFKWYQAPHHWYAKAFELRRSARALYKALLPGLRRHEQAAKRAKRVLDQGVRQVVAIRSHSPDVRPVYMLYGFALENLLKGLLIARTPHLISERSLSKRIVGHNLRALLRNAGISVNAEEEEALRWTEEAVVWKARYPVPAKINGARGFFEPGDPGLRQVQVRKRILEDIFVRIEATLKTYAKRPRGFGVWVQFH
jgi:hypothetical protein